MSQVTLDVYKAVIRSVVRSVDRVGIDQTFAAPSFASDQRAAIPAGQN